MKMSSKHSALKVTLSAAKLIAAPALMSAMMTVMVVGGCYAPQPTELYRTDELLTDTEYVEMARCWTELSRSNYNEWKSYSENEKIRVNQLWTKVHQEMLERGELTPATRTAMRDTAEYFNTKKLVSFDTIASNPTPDLNGQFESWDRRRQNDSMIYNQNFRALADEWSRFWLMEMPGGTPYDTVNTTGRF